MINLFKKKDTVPTVPNVCSEAITETLFDNKGHKHVRITLSNIDYNTLSISDGYKDEIIFEDYLEYIQRVNSVAKKPTYEELEEQINVLEYQVQTMIASYTGKLTAPTAPTMVKASATALTPEEIKVCTLIRAVIAEIATGNRTANRGVYHKLNLTAEEFFAFENEEHIPSKETLEKIPQKYIDYYTDFIRAIVVGMDKTLFESEGPLIQIGVSKYTVKQALIFVNKVHKQPYKKIATALNIKSESTINEFVNGVRRYADAYSLRNFNRETVVNYIKTFYKNGDVVS